MRYRIETIMKRLDHAHVKSNTANIVKFSQLLLQRLAELQEFANNFYHLYEQDLIRMDERFRTAELAFKRLDQEFLRESNKEIRESEHA